jgi:hypothetical protein
VFESGEDLVTRYVFTDTESGVPKEKGFCKVCGTPLWAVSVPVGAPEDKTKFIRPVLLDNG